MVAKALGDDLLQEVAFLGVTAVGYINTQGHDALDLAHREYRLQHSLLQHNFNKMR